MDMPGADLAEFHAIVVDTRSFMEKGDDAGASERITDLETAWDDAQSRLEPLDPTAWGFLDSEIDSALRAVRSDHHDVTEERSALDALARSLTP